MIQGYYVALSGTDAKAQLYDFGRATASKKWSLVTPEPALPDGLDGAFPVAVD